MEIKGTESEKNLQAALVGESLARNQYTFFALAARKAGQDAIADALERMAKNEMMHAKFWFECLYGQPLDTLNNLKHAAQGEFKEWHEMYPAFAQQAREDGLEDLAIMFDRVAAIERDHERQFMSLCTTLIGTTQKKTPPPETPAEGYRCLFCGAVFPHRLDVCEVCQAIGSFEPCTY